MFMAFTQFNGIIIHHNELCWSSQRAALSKTRATDHLWLVSISNMARPNPDILLKVINTLDFQDLVQKKVKISVIFGYMLKRYHFYIWG